MSQQDTGQGGPIMTKGGSGPDDVAAARAASARGWLRLFLVALLCGVLASGLVLPWKVLTLVVSLFALAAGVVALVKAISAKLPRLVVIATSLGLAATLVLAAGTGASVLIWPVTQTYEECMSRALTLQAQGACEDGLRQLEGFRN